MVPSRNQRKLCRSMALLVKKEAGSPCWCHPKSWGLRCTSWRHVHGEKALMCGGRHATIFLQCTGAQMSPCPPRGWLSGPPTQAGASSLKRITFLRLESQWSVYSSSMFATLRSIGSAIRVAIRQRFLAIGNRKHPRHFCCSVHSPSRGALPLGPRQFGWQFAGSTRRFGNMRSAIRLLCALSLIHI